MPSLNRLLSISTAPTAAGSGAISSAYAYNQANQRLRRTEADGTYWVYEYDNLGQVVSGKRYWAGGVPVAGQQYEYTYDDIGNRKSAKQGGNDAGAALRSASYTANLLNQYSSWTNPPAVDVLGLGNVAATVTVALGNTGSTGDAGESPGPWAREAPAGSPPLRGLALAHGSAVRGTHPEAVAGMGPPA